MLLKIKIAVCVIYFLVLYLIAFFSAKGYYKDFPHFLGVEDTQWQAIFVMWIPVLVACLLK